MEAHPEAVTRDAGVATESSDRGRGGDRTRVSNALLLPPGAGKMTSCVSGSRGQLYRKTGPPDLPAPGAGSGPGGRAFTELCERLSAAGPAPA